MPDSTWRDSRWSTVAIVTAILIVSGFPLIVAGNLLLVVLARDVYLLALIADLAGLLALGALGIGTAYVVSSTRFPLCRRLYWITFGLTIVGNALLLHDEGLGLWQFAMAGPLQHRLVVDDPIEYFNVVTPWALKRST